jgi:hypothetical protein
MALPTIEKTWTFSLNNAVPDTVSLYSAIAGAFSLGGFTALTGGWYPADPLLNPCTIGGYASPFPSNAIWNLCFSKNQNPAGSRASGTFYSSVLDLHIFMDFNTSSLGAATMTATQGSHDPVIINPTNQALSAASGPFVLHALASTDGECLRIFVCRAGFVTFFFLADKIKNPRTGITDVVFGMYGTDNLSQNCCDYTALYLGQFNISGPMLRVYSPAGVLGHAVFSTETVDARALGQENTTVDDIDGSWPLTPIGIYSGTPGAIGRYGMLYDLWFGSTGVSSGDSYDETGNKVLGQLNNLVFPTNGVTLLTS